MLYQKYQDWKDGLPDMKWLEDVMPDNDKWHQWRGSLIDFKNNVKDNIEIGMWYITFTYILRSKQA